MYTDVAGGGGPGCREREETVKHTEYAQGDFPKAIGREKKGA